MDFEKRLEKAIERGSRARAEQGSAAQNREATEEDLRNRHSAARIELSEHIDGCFRKLADHFPGFRFETVVGENGWGARITRDDVSFKGRRSTRNLYSRLEMVVRPFTATHIVEMSSKGTIRNRELLSRSNYQFLAEMDLDTFRQTIDLWVLEYAEQYAAGA